MITVLLADDDVLVRQGLRVLLESADDLHVVAEAADGAEAIDLARQTTPDVVVMDVRMPRTDGIEATREIASWPEPRPRVLVLTTFDLDEIVHDALEAGADGFLLKRTTPEELIEGIRTVAAGEALISGDARPGGFLRTSPPTQADRRVLIPGRSADRTRSRGAALPDRRPVERGDRGEALDRSRDGEDPPQAHLHEDRDARPHPGGRLGLPERVRHRELISRDPDRCTPSSFSCGEASAGTETSGLKTPLRCSSVKRPWIIS